MMRKTLEKLQILRDDVHEWRKDVASDLKYVNEEVKSWRMHLNLNDLEEHFKRLDEACIELEKVNQQSKQEPPEIPKKERKLFLPRVANLVKTPRPAKIGYKGVLYTSKPLNYRLNPEYVGLRIPKIEQSCSEVDSDNDYDVTQSLLEPNRRKYKNGISQKCARESLSIEGRGTPLFDRPPDISILSSIDGRITKKDEYKYSGFEESTEKLTRKERMQATSTSSSGNSQVFDSEPVVKCPWKTSNSSSDDDVDTKDPPETARSNLTSFNSRSLRRYESLHKKDHSHHSHYPGDVIEESYLGHRGTLSPSVVNLKFTEKPNILTYKKFGR